MAADLHKRKNKTHEGRSEMSDFMTRFFVFALTVVSVGTILMLFGNRWRELVRNTLKGASVFKDSYYDTGPREKNRKPIGSGAGTVWMPSWMIMYRSRDGVVEVPLSLNIGELYRIGKDSNCDLVIPSSMFLGRIHAVISRDKDGYFIQDNNSKNGMFADGTTRIEEADITDGLCVRLANVKLTFRKADMASYDTGVAEPSSRRIRKADAAVGTRVAVARR